jgi:2-keto-4-pentenoate hydratase/2-oxohepta-3-ene-1,7-dioic acid hydratase in catechol pathway
MKLLRYGELGNEKPGILDHNGEIRDLSAYVKDIDGSTLSLDTLTLIQQLELSELPKVNGSPRLGACVNRIGKFICIGLNYADHAKETGSRIPEQPIIFMKATSAVCGPNDNIIKPLNSTKLDWEVELAIVIGKDGVYISEQQADDHIAGYCVCNDVSERAFQLEMGGQWDKGKGCDTFGPIGPWLVTKDEIDNVLDLSMQLSVNGKMFQNGSTSTMIFSPQFIVSYLSQFMSLQAGDMISTGTPPGVGLGQKPPLYLQHGDTIKLSIAGLGEQQQTVVDFQQHTK